MDTSTEGLYRLKDQMIIEHNNFSRTWNDIVKFVRYDANEVYNETTYGKGQDKTINQFDGTATWSHNMLASFLLGSFVSPNERWVSFGVEGRTLDSLPKELKEWIENAENALFNQYANPRSNFYPTMHETILDDTSIGTSIAYHDFNKEIGNLHYESVSVFKAHIGESYAGFVDIIHREREMSVRQIYQEYGEEMFVGMSAEQEKKFRDKLRNTPMEELKVDIFVYPTKEGDSREKRGFKFSCDHILQEYKTKIKKSGYKTFPYNVSRWSKLSNETYGRGPAFSCIREIKMLNKMRKTIMKFAHKQVDPPMVMTREGIMLPFNFNPEGRNFIEEGATVAPIETRGEVAITIEMLRDARDHITKSFFIDWLVQGQDNVEKTAYQIQDKRNEQFFLLSATIGRLSSEKLGRMLHRDLNLLIENNVIEDIPQVTDANGNPFTIRPMYISQAARSQQFLKAANAMRWMESVVQLSNVFPEARHYVNIGNLLRRVADYSAVPEDVIRSEQDAQDAIKQEQQAAQQAAQQEQEMRMAEMAAKQQGQRNE